MKNKTLLSIATVFMLLFCNLNVTEAQIYKIVNDPGDNYFEKQKQMETVLKGFPATKDKEQQRQEKIYNRWNWFWQGRVNASGSFKDYPEALKEYFANYQPSSKTSHPQWASLGPTHNNGSFSIRGEIGKCNKVWANPSNQNEVFLASNGGGFWKTTNGGRFLEGVGWRNVAQWCPGLCCPPYKQPDYICSNRALVQRLFKSNGPLLFGPLEKYQLRANFYTH